MNAATWSAANEGELAETAKLGMWVFLASEVLFFGGMLVAYLFARSHWPDGFAAASRETHVAIGTVNTALLLTSSALVALAAAVCRERGHGSGVAWLLGAAAALGIAFLALKGVEYHAEWQEHLVPGAGFRLRQIDGAALFFVLYFLMTGVHAVHLVIGICTLGVLAVASHHPARWIAPRHIEAAGLYWHFVDIVWIFLYPLIYLAGRNA